MSELLLTAKGWSKPPWRPFGRVDLLFNNAGVYYPSTILGCSEEEWDTTIDVNLKGNVPDVQSSCFRR